MAFNGSGVFNRVHDWTNDAAAKIKIVSSRHDENDDDIAQGLSNALCRDGQSTVTADISLSTHKLTNLAAPVADTDAATKGYVDGPRARTNGIDISGAGTPNGMVSFSSSTGANGLSFKAADLSWLARMAGTPAASLNRLVLNDKVDGSGTDVAVITDTGNLSVSGTIGAAGAATFGGVTTNAGLIIKAAAGSDAIAFNNTAGTATFMSLSTPVAAQGDGTLKVAAQSFVFNTSGQFKAPGAIFANAALLNTDGNVSGTVWDQWGHHDAISAISAQIEARTLAVARSVVAQIYMQRSGSTYSGNVGDVNGWTCPAGTVIIGYARAAGVNGAVYGLYYTSLQIYDPVNGWRTMGG